MPNYRMTVALPVMTHNGKQYQQGAYVMTSSLTQEEADHINNSPYLTGLKATLIEEAAKEPESPIEMDAAKAEADALGLKYQKNISLEKLIEKIETTKEAQK